MQRWSGVRTVKDFQEGFQKKGHLACALTSRVIYAGFVSKNK